jgi:hypothetical protein
MVNARDSHGNSYGVFISLEGWWTLAGGNTPGNRPTTLRPGGGLESTAGHPISCIRPILPHHPHPKSTLANPTSTVDLGCEPLIKVENGLRPPLPPTRRRSIIRPENKGIQPKSNRHKPKNFKASGVPWGLVSMMSLTQRGSGLPRRSAAKAGCPSVVDGRSARNCANRCQPMPSYASLCQPPPPPVFLAVALCKWWP